MGAAGFVIQRHPLSMRIGTHLDDSGGAKM